MFKCPVCESRRTKFVLEVDEIWDKKFKVFYCENCIFYFLKGRPSKAQTIKYYQKEYYNFNFLKQIIKNYFRFFRSFSQNYYINQQIKIENFSILEIGACDGILLNTFKGKNKVLGTEFNLKYKKIAKKKYNIKLINKNYEELKQKFDFIILSHVFEHFHDINKAIKNLINILNPKGYIFIELPNSPKYKDVSDEELNEFLQTTHIYNFSEKSIRIFFQRHHLKIIDLSRFYYRISEFYNKSARENIIRTIIKGDGPNINNFFPILIYFLKAVLNPINSYKKLSLVTPWKGLGDNIRLILQKL